MAMVELYFIRKKNRTEKVTCVNKLHPHTSIAVEECTGLAGTVSNGATQHKMVIGWFATNKQQQLGFKCYAHQDYCK